MNEEHKVEQPPAPALQMEKEPTVPEVARMIADRLGETESGPRKQVERIVWTLGRTQARTLLERTVQIEEQGGMMLPDGSRRRTAGGVFFTLAYTEGVPKQGKKLFKPGLPSPGSGKPKIPANQAQPSTRPAFPPLNWEERGALIDELSTQKGVVTTVKMTVIGTVGKWQQRGDCIVAVMEHTGEKIPALPKGVPAPPAQKQRYVLWIAAKQWRSVEATVSDSEDLLIAEGFPQHDPKTGAISVFVSSVTSKKLQAAKRLQSKS